MRLELTYLVQNKGMNPRNSPDVYWLALLLEPFVDKTTEKEIHWLAFEDTDSRSKSRKVTDKDIYYYLTLILGDGSVEQIDFIGYKSKKGMVIIDCSRSYNHIMNKMIEIIRKIQKETPEFKMYIKGSAIPEYIEDKYGDIVKGKDEFSKKTPRGTFRPSYNKIFRLDDEIVWVPNKGFESAHELTTRISVKNQLPTDVSKLIKEYLGKDDNSFFHEKRKTVGKGGKRRKNGVRKTKRNVKRKIIFTH
jgi:hypothetical protein